MGVCIIVVDLVGIYFRKYTTLGFTLQFIKEVTQPRKQQNESAKLPLKWRVTYVCLRLLLNLFVPLSKG